MSKIYTSTNKLSRAVSKIELNNNSLEIVERFCYFEETIGVRGDV